MRLPTSSDEGPSVEMTAIIDMVFLLLIFFLVATTFQQSEREIDIALPAAASAQPLSARMREIVINVREDGGVLVQGRAMAPGDLSEMLARASEMNPEQKVMVRGDRRTAYANVVRVLDVCKSAGIQTPFLETRVGAEDAAGS